MANQMVSGPYSAQFGTYIDAINGVVPLGVIGPDGFELESNWQAEEIQGDNLGATTQEAIHQGGTLYVNCVFQEMDRPAVLAATYPFDDFRGGLGAMGQKYTDMARYLILSRSYVNSPIPDTYTPYFFPFACLAPNFSVKELIATRLRNIPMRFIIFPFIDAADNEIKHYTSQVAPTNPGTPTG